MLFVGLVHARDWELPEEPSEPPEPSPDPRWTIPWRAIPWQAIATVLAWWALLAFVPSAVHDAFGGLAGYLALRAVVGLGCWRLERWCSRQYWRGLRDYKP